MIVSYDKRINRKVRVFISSTFSDMEKERNAIVYSVFPRLRQEFSSQLIDINEVDLRWGVPEEDSDNSKILEICIGEVLHCAPFFVGIVGQRYGTTTSVEEISNLPPAYRKAIGENLPEEVSITELEMRAGAFVPNNIDFSYFFIKKDIDKKVILPQLNQLIENINTTYTAYTYDDLATFEEQIYRSMKDCIQKVIPERLTIPYADKYYYSHLSILKNNALRYIQNSLFIARIECKLAEQHRVYLKGEKGIGKSACISWLAKQEGVDRDGNVFFHFGAVGNDSLNVDNAFFRLRLYLQTLTDYKSSETDNRAIVTELLSMLPTGFKLTLYFDALDCFSDVTAIYQFFALADINQNVFVVCSGTENYKRIPIEQTIEATKLTPDQIRQILKGSLSDFGKKLDETRQFQIIEKESCSNPLFLQAFITQLRMYGAYDEFDAFFNQLMRANSFSEVFAIVIERLKTYFLECGLTDSLVDKALAMIVYSKNGVKENELQEILDIMPITRSVFLKSIELFTIEENGLIRFNHDMLIQATKGIIGEANIDYERVVAELYVEFFSKQQWDWRRYSEETFQLHKLNWTQLLIRNLSNKDCFTYLRRNEYHSLIGYLSGLLSKQFLLTDTLVPQLKESEKTAIADVLCQAGCHYAAISIVESQLDKELNPKRRIQLLDIMARSQYKLGLDSFRISINTYKELLSYYEATYPEDEVGYAARAYLLGVAYKTTGKLDSAAKLLENCASIYEKHRVKTATSVWVMDVYSESCYTSGELKKALGILDKAITTCIDLFGKSSSELAWSYCYSWTTLYSLGEKTASLKMIWDAYEIYNQIYFGRGTKFAWAALNAGTASMIARDYKRAKDLYKFAIDENDSILPEEDRPHAYSLTAYANLANLSERVGNHSASISYIDYALDESMKKNGVRHIYTANILLNAGILKHDPKAIKNAIRLYKMQSLNTPDIYFARVCLSRILELIGKEEEAISEINSCAKEYFSENRETELISYLIIETLDKICGNLTKTMIDTLYRLCRFDDYEFYLTHNNNSNVIIVPSI